MSYLEYLPNAGDYLSYVNGQAFTTRDRDNDNNGDNCATYHTNNCGSLCFHNSGWWYNSCGAPLNGPYGTTCLAWFTLPGSFCNIKFTEMKVRPI